VKTTLDQRFSDADAIPTGWGETRKILQEAQLSWICTVRADGRFEQPGGGPALVFEVRPAKVLAFAKGRFGQTRHSFA
jgi:hypothetical protein